MLIPYELIVQKVMEKTKLKRSEVEHKVERKLQELSGLLSKEGAAHIVANELGVDVLPSPDKPVAIAEILEGMGNITINAKVLQKYESREFTRNNGTGKVCSILVGDATGRMRVAFWNGAVKLLDQVAVDDVVQIRNLYAKNNQGRIELSANDRSQLTRSPKGVIIEEVADAKITSGPSRVFIKDMKPNMVVTAAGIIVQLFKPSFFEVCPQCNKRVRGKPQGYVCEAHGEVEPAYSYVLNAVLDDGTGNMRVVFFRDQALELLKINHEAMLKLREDAQALEHLKQAIIGAMLKVRARVSQNALLGRIEIVVYALLPVSPVEEIHEIEQL